MDIEQIGHMALDLSLGNVSHIAYYQTKNIQHTRIHVTAKHGFTLRSMGMMKILKFVEKQK